MSSVEVVLTFPNAPAKLVIICPNAWVTEGVLVLELEEGANYTGFYPLHVLSYFTIKVVVDDET